MNVAIIGCGPSGLLAAHAAAIQGHDIRIYSIMAKSPVGSAQFMHDSIPELSSIETRELIAFQKYGTKHGYAKKVYGRSDAPCSWTEFPIGYMTGWPVRPVYDQLWKLYKDKIINLRVTAQMVRSLVKDYDLVISTIPAHTICYAKEHHLFPKQDIWITGDERIGREIPNNTMVYNGESSTPWYRASRLFGQLAVEYAAQPPRFAHQGKHNHVGFKPIDTNCDCHPEVVRAGRFGEWRKGVLLHHAYETAFRAVREPANAVL